MGKILRILLFVLCVFCAAGASHAGVEGDAYRVSYVCNDPGGGQRWQATAEIRHKEGDVYTITEKMEGVYSGFDGRISWVATTDFRRTKDALRPLDMDQRVFDAGGRPIAVIKQYFNYDDKVVTCAYEDLIKKTVSKKEFVFSGDIINRLLQGLCGQKFLEAGQVSKKMQVISPEPALYNFVLRRIGEEEMELNGRKVKAYKLCFDPMLGIFSFIKIFLPRSYVWHSAEPIHEWLKYDGLESGVDSPRVEIISLEKEETTSIPEPRSRTS